MDQSLSNELLYLISNFHKLTHKYRPGSEIHQGEFMMLGTICKCMDEKKEKQIDEPGVKVSELSERIHSTKPATSKMLKVIEEKGYIERIPDSKDRRVVYIRISPKGDKLIKEAFRIKYEFINCTIERIGEKDSKEFIRLLKLFYQNIEEVLDERSKMCNCHDIHQLGQKGVN